MPISPTNKPHIFITMGDPSGIGPEIIMRSMASPDIMGLAVFFVIGDKDVLTEAADRFFKGRTCVHPFVSDDVFITPEDDALNIIAPSGKLSSSCNGNSEYEDSAKAIDSLDTAISLIMKSAGSTAQALVTAPLSKERISTIKPGFIGHTEYLQQAFSLDAVTMVMVGERLNVVPITRHIPLKDVAGSLTADKIVRTLEQVIENRTIICGKTDARIGVCALNPHSGEGGKIGTEEIDIIAPAIEKIKSSYQNIIGPVSADVIFYQALDQKIDIVIGMYHDQCLAPFKMIDFSNGVNMTLGLGFTRTSPDHGTAFDIAGKGIADPGSMQSAIRLAIRAAQEVKGQGLRNT